MWCAGVVGCRVARGWETAGIPRTNRVGTNGYISRDILTYGVISTTPELRPQGPTPRKTPQEPYTGLRRPTGPNGPESPGWVRAVLFILIALRQYAFLPMVTHIVAMLVMHRGSDAISICFNALAVLFLLDIDTALFQFWVPERVREHMEEFGAPTIRETSPPPPMCK